MSGIARLSDDLLSELLCLAAGSDIAQKIAMTHVSTHWRRVALSSPLLWTSVCLDKKRDCSSLPLIMERCGSSALLDIKVTGDRDGSDARSLCVRDRAPLELELAMRALEPYAARIRSIDTTIPSSSLLGANHNFVVLHTLRVHSETWYQLPAPALCLIAPNLRILDMRNVPVTRLENLLSSRLQQLRLYRCGHVLHSDLPVILARCVSLVHLSFWSEETHVQPGSLDDKRWDMPPLRHLRTLEICLPIPLLVRVLQHAMHAASTISSIAIYFPEYLSSPDLERLWPALPLAAGPSHITGLEIESRQDVTLFDDCGRIFQVFTRFDPERPLPAQIWPCISAAYRAHKTECDVTIPLSHWNEMAEEFALYPPRAVHRLCVLMHDWSRHGLRNLHLTSLRRVDLYGTMFDFPQSLALNVLQCIICDDGQKLEVRLDSEVEDVEDMRQRWERSGRYQLVEGVCSRSSINVQRRYQPW